MKRLMGLLLLLGMGSSVAMAEESFKLDFTNTGGLVQDGWNAYYATHEVQSTFTAQSYSAFGTTVTVLPTWATGALNTCMQMINRGATDTANGNVRAYPTDAASDFNLITDWIGTDLRQAGDPLTITISGLPAGEYYWKSYHNDVNNINQGSFILTVNDASGSHVQPSMTTSNTGDPAAVMVFETLISCNGNPISFVFDGTGATDTYLTMVLCNGFELTQARSTGAALLDAPGLGNEFTLGDIDVLSWKPAIDDPNVSAVTKYDLTFTNDPNFANPEAYRVTFEDIAAVEPVTSFSLSANSIDLDYGTTYYWRVDSYVTWDSSSITTPNPIVGSLWNFVIRGLVPLVETNPVHTLVDENGNATLTGLASVVTTEYRWFKVGVNGDTMITDNAVFSDSTTATLKITGATSSDEGQYYFIAYNGDPATGTASEPSEKAWLWLPHITSHYEFETLVEGALVDSVGGFNATVNKDDENLTGWTAVTPAELAAGLPELGGNGLSFGGNQGIPATYTNAEGTSVTEGRGNFVAMAPGVVDYKDLTISAWVYWNGGNAWQRIIDCGNDTNNYLFITPGNGTDGGNLSFALKQNGTEVSVTTAALPVGEWSFVTATLSGDTARIFVNGEYKNKNTITFDPINFAPVNNYLGKSMWAGDPYFNGIIDDLKIYNYARDNEQVALDYLALKGQWICDHEHNDLEYDFDDNCQIDILDFASFAATWMDSYRIYPQAQE